VCGGLTRQRSEVSAYDRRRQPSTSRERWRGVPRPPAADDVDPWPARPPVAFLVVVKGASVLGVTRCLSLGLDDRVVRSTAGGWVGTWPCLAWEGGRAHRAWWRSTARPRPRRSADARGSSSEIMNCAGGRQGRHGRGSPCPLAIRWRRIARVAGDHARGGGEPRRGAEAWSPVSAWWGLIRFRRASRRRP
jgi:hypothetical protein